MRIAVSDLSSRMRHDEDLPIRLSARKSIDTARMGCRRILPQIDEPHVIQHLVFDHPRSRFRDAIRAAITMPSKYSGVTVREAQDRRFRCVIDSTLCGMLHRKAGAKAALIEAQAIYQPHGNRFTAWVFTNIKKP